MFYFFIEEKSNSGRQILPIEVYELDDDHPNILTKENIDHYTVNSSTTNDRFNKIAQILLPFATKKDKIPRSFIGANDVSTTWQALPSQTTIYRTNRLLKENK